MLLGRRAVRERGVAAMVAIAGLVLISLATRRRLAEYCYQLSQVRAAERRPPVVN